MATPFPFVSGAVLEAAELNAITELPIEDKTASYVLVAGDAGKRVIMNAAGATTITVNNSLFVAGQMVFIANKGAGTCTVTAGAGVTVNVNGSLAVTQYGGGTLLALSASSFVFFPGSVKSTLSVDYLLVGGGGGGARYSQGCGGGGGGGFRTATDLIAKGNAYTITVGAAGAGSTQDGRQGYNGTASSFIRSANGGGGGGSYGGQNGGSGGGAGPSGGAEPGGSGISGEGNAGGAYSGSGTAGGGGGGSAATGSSNSGNTGGAGGAGTSNDYNGTSQAYSGGGGGGGTGGGGAAGDGSATAGAAGGAGNAPANRGGGGGGGTGGGGNGGSGRVVLRIVTTDLTGFTVTTTGSPATGTNGSYTYYDYTATGTFRID